MRDQPKRRRNADQPSSRPPRKPRHSTPGLLRKRDTDRCQGRLFDVFGRSYSFYVTNLDWASEEIARFYDKRADVERTICEAKNDLNIHHVPTSSFGANAADLALKILAETTLTSHHPCEIGDYA